MSDPSAAAAAAVAAVAAVRRFNRTVTQRVGALDEHYLSGARPLGQARVLWEIGSAGDAGVEIGVLRTRLGVDAAQLSRTVRVLQDDELVDVRAHAADSRVRMARATATGRAEFRTLDARSDDLARTILGPLDDAQRTRLVEAMADVERLLTRSMVEITERPLGDPAARACLRAYAAEIEQRFAVPFESGGDDRLAAPRGAFLVATLSGEPVGAGGVADLDTDSPEIKRLWTAPDARGLGLGRRLLSGLETIARDHGARVVRLDTHGSLVEAMALYRSAGYREIARYNDNPHAEHWFAKRLR